MAVNSFREDEYMEKHRQKEDFKPAAFLFIRL